MKSAGFNTLLAAVGICASAGGGHSFNSSYIQERDRRYAEQDKALAKKKLVREQIRARRAAIKGALK